MTAEANPVEKSRIEDLKPERLQEPNGDRPNGLGESLEGLGWLRSLQRNNL